MKKAIKHIILSMVAVYIAIYGFTVTAAAKDNFYFGTFPKDITSSSGDLTAFSYRINSDTAVSGDILGIAFTEINIKDSVGGNVRVAGGSFRSESEIYKNVTVFAGDISTKDSNVIWGNAYFAGGDAALGGTFKKNLYIYGQNVRISGKIEGDLILHTGYGRAEITESAEIKGNIYHYGAYPIDGGNNYYFHNTKNGISIIKPLLSGLYIFVVLTLIMLAFYYLFGDFYCKKPQSSPSPQDPVQTEERSHINGNNKPKKPNIVTVIIANILKILLISVFGIFFAVAGILVGCGALGIGIFLATFAVLGISVAVCIVAFYAHIISVAITRMIKKTRPIVTLFLSTLSVSLIYSIFKILAQPEKVGIYFTLLAGTIWIISYFCGSVIIWEAIKRYINGGRGKKRRYHRKKM